MQRLDNATQTWRTSASLLVFPSSVHGYGQYLYVHAGGDLYRTLIVTEGEYYMHRKL